MGDDEGGDKLFLILASAAICAHGGKQRVVWRDNH